VGTSVDALRGKAVVVTGAGRGIGVAYARHAASEGARVVVNDVDADVAEEVTAQIRSSGATAIAHHGDVSVWTDAHDLIERCLDEFGAIDGLVNNAGIIRVRRAEELDEETFRRVVEVNLLGTAYCGTHAIKRMLQQGHGSIVNVTSGSQAGWKLLAAYSASKGGVASLTYTWAIELADTGIRVNAVSPTAATRMLDEFAAYLGPDRAPSPPRDESSAANNAPVVTYLLSDAAQGINGQVVRIDRRALSLVTHPSILLPVVERGEWTFADVQAAFERQLRSKVLPLGMAQVSQSVSDGGARLGLDPLRSGEDRR